LLTQDGNKLITVTANNWVYIQQQYNELQYDLRKLMFLWLLVKRVEPEGVYIRDMCRNLKLDHDKWLDVWASSFSVCDKNKILEKVGRIVDRRKRALKKVLAKRERAMMKKIINGATNKLLRNALFDEISTAL